jgi:hypothetical protein
VIKELKNVVEPYEAYQRARDRLADELASLFHLEYVFVYEDELRVRFGEYNIFIRYEKLSEPSVSFNQCNGSIPSLEEYKRLLEMEIEAKELAERVAEYLEIGFINHHYPASWRYETDGVKYIKIGAYGTDDLPYILDDRGVLVDEHKRYSTLESAYMEENRLWNKYEEESKDV